MLAYSFITFVIIHEFSRKSRVGEVGENERRMRREGERGEVGGNEGGRERGEWRRYGENGG